MKNRQTINAIAINIYNLLSSVSVKMCILILILASTIFSFWPFVNEIFVNNETKVSVNTNLEEYFEDIDGISLVNDEADVCVAAVNGIYEINLQNSVSEHEIGVIKSILYKKNMETFMLKNKDITDDEIALLSNANITVNYLDDVENVDSEVAVKIMIFILIILIMLIIMINRISAKVAYNKGNQITETILTTMSKEKMYFIEIVANTTVVMVCLMAAIIPILISKFVGDLNYVMDFSKFGKVQIIIVLLFLLVSITSYIVFAIGIVSLSIRPEDSNIAVIILMLPMYISFYYSITQMDMFNGAFGFLNYIPLTSVFTNVAYILQSKNNYQEMLIVFLINLLVLMLIVGLGKKVYCKNISKN